MIRLFARQAFDVEKSLNNLMNCIRSRPYCHNIFNSRYPKSVDFVNHLRAGCNRDDPDINNTVGVRCEYY
jgi:hypothetical protein